MALTRQLAELRYACIDPNQYVHYTVHIELLKGKQYRAYAEMEFNVVKLDEQLQLDWQGSDKINLIVNQQPTQHVLQNGLLRIPHLNIGLNKVTVHYENEYSSSGHGLHSFEDTDGQQYIYSQCEPFHASKMFPCFDQPDIKATLKVVAQAPTDWTVISNEINIPQLTTDLTITQSLGYLNQKDGYTLHEFKQTVPLSTYLFAIIAGPYSLIPCPHVTTVPMNLYCRASLKQYLDKDADEIFTMTIDGLKYYEQLFQTKYPFSKYDQIFCPEYSSGAMENAGAVTINDTYIFKEDVPLSQKADRGNTILHELSHMWFGDLVTMKWWDDLWLNESFAEFISHLCQWKTDKSGKIDHWVQFFERKVWGYVEDQMQTTHPIYCIIDNTDQAENIFDGITYAKGAALLKQLFFMMGEDKFSDAMGQYFKLYKFKNSTLADFFGVMKQAFQGDYLMQWQQDWIMKAGLNTIQVEVNGQNAIFTQGYTLPQHSTLRSQTFQVAIYNVDGGLVRTQQVNLLPQPQTSIDLQLNGDEVLMLNYNDQSFVKTLYSEQQVKFLLNNLSKLEPSLSRILVLRSVWDQVRDGCTSFQTFIDGVLSHLLVETDDTVSKMVLQWCSGGVSFYTPRPYRSELKSKLTNLIIELIRKTDPTNKNKLLVLKRYLANWGVSEDILKLLIQYIKSDTLEFGNIGLKNGWTIIRHVFAYSQIPIEQKWELYDIWAKKDGSDEVRLQKRYLECLDTQQDLWSYFVNYNKEESVQMIEEAMSAFNHDIHATRLLDYEGQYFAVLPQVFETKSSEYAKAFYSSLYPINDNVELYIKRCGEILQNTKNDILIRNLKESIDADTRRLKTYQVYNKQ